MGRFNCQKAVVERLTTWYQAGARSLPWRSAPLDVYAIWVSEIMLQQTQVAVVVEYFRRWMQRFPTVETLAQASLEEVLAHWSGLGYYRRARGLYQGAKWIAEFGMPTTRAAWLEVPGVGPYTAGAICSIALGQPEALVDGNVERVFSRWHCLRRPLLKKTWALAREWIGLTQEPGMWNQALMELGATLCTPKKPRCEICPIQKSCRAFLTGNVKKFPSPKPKPKWRTVVEHRICAVDPKGRILIHQPNWRWRQGLWDLPEKLPWTEKSKPELVIKTRLTVTHHKISRTTQVIRLRERRAPTAFKWLNPEALHDVPHGAPLKKFIASYQSSGLFQIALPKG